MIILDPALVAAAQQGSRTALENLVKAAQKPVYNLAVRMLGHPGDAEDAAQEILIRIITHLGDVREPGAAGAWAFRIACRHLVETRRAGHVESMRLTFRGFGADLEDGLADLPDDTAENPETRAMVEEVKVGCTLALLTCLSRPLRAAYILGEIFELTDAEAADALGMEAPAFRQRLRRGRAQVTSFLESKCGIVSAEAQCRCDRRVAKAERIGRVQRGRPMMPRGETPGPSIDQVRARVADLERDRAAAALMRSNPDFTTRIGERVMAALSSAV